MSELYWQNLATVEQRWPQLASQIDAYVDNNTVVLIDDGPEQTIAINDIHLTSCYNRKSEAHLQAAQLPINPDLIHVYGFGLGDLIKQLLQHHQAKIYCHIFSLSAFKAAILLFDLQDILGNSDLELNYAVDETQIKTPYLVSPAELVVADNECLRLRDEIQLALADSYMSEQIDKVVDTWKQQITGNKHNIKNSLDVAELNEQGMDDAVVVGAGPSLTRSLPRISELQNSGAYIYAVDAAISPLVDFGIIPDYVITLDHKRDPLMKFYADHIVSKMGTSSLVYFPVVHKDIIGRWPGSKYCAYTQNPIYDVIKQEIPRGELFASGSVYHPAVDLAVKMGSRRVYLAGADFSFPNNESHASGSYYQKKIEISGHEKYLENGYDKRVPSIQSLVMYLRDLEKYIALHSEVEFINLSRDGAKIDRVFYED